MNFTNTVFNIDCLEGLKQLPDNSIDVIISDPPYWLGSYLKIDKHGQYVGTTRDIVDSWYVGDGYWFEKVMLELNRVLKYGGYCLLFSIDRFVDLPMYNARRADFDVCQSIYWKFRQGMPKGSDSRKRIEALIYQGSASTMSLRKQEYENKTGIEIELKQGSNGFINNIQIRKRKSKTKPISDIGKSLEGSKYGLATLSPAIEVICVFRKKKKNSSFVADMLAAKNDLTIHPSIVNIHKLLKNGKYPSHLIVEQNKPTKKEKNIDGVINTHPTVKPLNLIKNLITLFSNENQLILDPFLGSGTTVAACIDLNRNYCGFEIDKNYFDLTQKRINLHNKLKTNP